MPGDLSSMESSRFLFLVRPIFKLLGIAASDQTMTFFIRKGAHFTEYAILGVIEVGVSHAWCSGRRARRMLLALWLAVPLIDETIQRFVPGRAGMARDVLIDLSGGLLGIALACLFFHVHKRSDAPLDE